jgi:hypothetical protein
VAALFFQMILMSLSLLVSIENSVALDVWQLRKRFMVKG